MGETDPVRVERFEPEALLGTVVFDPPPEHAAARLAMQNDIAIRNTRRIQHPRRSPFVAERDLVGLKSAMPSPLGELERVIDGTWRQPAEGTQKVCFSSTVPLLLPKTAAGRAVVALNLGTAKRSLGPAPDRGLLADVKLLGDCLVGPCGALTWWQRKTTHALVKLAIRGTDAAKRVELAPDGWRVREAALEDDAAVATSLDDRITASIARDFASGRARVASRPRATEAADR